MIKDLLTNGKKQWISKFYNFINIFLINKMTIKTIEDTKTGLLNEKILLNTNKLQYESTNTYLSK